jgi:uncharacterized protein (TIGR02145 family)
MRWNSGNGKPLAGVWRKGLRHVGSFNRFIVAVTLLCTANGLLFAQEVATVRAFTSAGTTEGNTYVSLGQPFFQQLDDNGYEVSYGVAQARLVEQTLEEETCENKTFTDEDGIFVIEPTHASGNYHYERYLVNGHPLHYDLHSALDLAVFPIYEENDTVMYHGTFPIIAGVQLQEGENILDLSTVHGCDSVVHLIALLCPLEVSDADNYTYNTLVLDNNCWTKENLKSEHYMLGETEGSVIGPEIPNMVYVSVLYPNAEENLNTYGRLYTWSAATREIDPNSTYVQGACPFGWHLPTMQEMAILMGYPADALRNETLWVGTDYSSNSTTFTALPAGRYHTPDARFDGLHTSTGFWSDSSDSQNGIFLNMSYHCDTMSLETDVQGNAYSIRCVKDLVFSN